MNSDRTLSSYNLPFLEALYEDWQRDPASVDPQWRPLLEQAARPTNGVSASAPAASASTDATQIDLQHRVERLVANYRLLGHIRSQTDPLQRQRSYDTPALDLEYYGLSERNLDQTFHPGEVLPGESATLREIVDRLKDTYCRHVGVEYWQMNRVDQREWLRTRMEACANEVVPSHEEQRVLLRSLIRADAVDRFLHQKFIGAKRFSASGAESVLSLLATLIEHGGEHGIESVYMGMAHRGRLSVMMNIFDQTPAQVFSRFDEGDALENWGRGDVKYHLGCYRNHTTAAGKKLYLALLFNPSHLEAITPVIAGRVRAGQDLHCNRDRTRALGVTMHGDAAVMGQGVYAETLNLSKLKSYESGGTIRVVLNNQVGFTTNPEESRSTVYCTAVADMLHVPVLHINGDDPEAAAYAAKLALEYRQQFASDVIIDLCCYRRFGHNEGDEPTFTQPQMYGLIKGHASVRALYQERLIARGTVDQAFCDAYEAEVRAEFEDALAQIKENGSSTAPAPMHGVWESFKGGLDADVPNVETKITAEDVAAVGRAVTTVPEGFNLHRKLKRFVAEQAEMAAGDAPVSWAFAEMLAYGSLLREGASVRLSGQDAVRGTFTHRHAGWTDEESEARHFPLEFVEGRRGTFEVINSPLSEFAVLGFEFGYSLAAPETLVIWEAQFGDFVNGAQVIIDQFISSSEDKWNRISGLVMLLPHGYEGQGPEHSSARFERFLQLCAEDNMQVCNFSCTSQMFHALRRQMKRKWRKPLVVMTPKSLLRTKSSFSPLSEFTDGEFHRIIDDADRADGSTVTRVLACTGKVYYDLVEARGDDPRVAVIRIEQLYPFPDAELDQILARYPNAKELEWVQEEPKNMGAWTFVRPYLEAAGGRKFSQTGNRRSYPGFIGREQSASPATGSSKSHKLEQQTILEAALEGLE
ncbi:MAG: 2-oxoglutarate dehydrogenase E1 component [Myxococcota bacterium]